MDTAIYAVDIFIAGAVCVCACRMSRRALTLEVDDDDDLNDVLREEATGDTGNKPKPARPLQAHNIVMICKVSIPSCTQLISECLNGYYGTFPGLIMRMHVPTCCVTLFRNSMHVVGTYNPHDALVAAYIMVGALAKIGVFVDIRSPMVCNAVRSVRLGHFVDLEKLYAMYGDRVRYESTFEGLHFEIIFDDSQGLDKRKTTVAIVFKTGSVVIAGGFDLHRDMNTPFVDILPMLRQCKCDNPPESRRAAEQAKRRERSGKRKLGSKGKTHAQSSPSEPGRRRKRFRPVIS